MIALRVILVGAALAALGAALVLPQPRSFAVTAPAGVLLFVVGAGEAAADAIPLRPLRMACALATMLLAALLIARGLHLPPALVAAAALAVQLIPLAPVSWGHEGSRSRPGPRSR